MKRIQAPTLQDAMAKTRAECGDNALVIETQATASGYVIIAARPDAQGVSSHNSDGASWATATPQPTEASTKRFATGFRTLAERARSFGIRDTILDAVDSALRGTRLRLDTDGDPAVPTVATRVLAALLPTVTPPIEATNSPRITAMVGPTGVGKTTTLAKLAAGARRAGQTVAILTIDTYRVSAAEHLRAYADMLGVPFEVALDADGLRRAVADHSHVDHVFIDTSGRSPFDRAAIEHLRARLSTAKPTCALCLPAAARHRDALSALRGFAPVGADQLILTKWDETTMPGEAVSIAAEQDLPLAHVTIGQEVPDDILPAQPEALARCAFGLASSLSAATQKPLPTIPAQKPDRPETEPPALPLHSALSTDLAPTLGSTQELAQ